MSRDRQSESARAAGDRAVSWFPGHMVKAQRDLAAEVRTADLVLELRDARLPRLSQNPFLATLTMPAKRLIVLNKSALADPSRTRAWQDHLNRGEVPCVVIDAERRIGMQALHAAIRRRTAAARDRFTRRGIRPPPPRVMVVGMPNVGKSTLINRIVARNRLPTAPVPGVTRGVRWVFLRNRLMLMDSPGVMLPRIDSTADAHRLGWTGAIRDAIIGVVPLGASLCAYLASHAPGSLHPLTGSGTRLPGTGEAILDAIALHRGAIARSGIPDRQGAAEVLLRAYRGGDLGRYTLEVPVVGGETE